MKHAQQDVEEILYLTVGRCVDGAAVCRFDSLEIPCREVVAEEAVDCHEGLADTELAEEVFYFSYAFVESALEPACCKSVERRLL